MAKITQQVDCSYCGYHNTVTMITEQKKYYRTIKVTKCENCKEQNGIKEILTRKQL